MSESDIPQPTRYIIWGKAGGRCQYRGCGEILYRDPTTQSEFNQAYLAHIIADKATGPRGDETLSPLLGRDISNIMLMCDRHHRMIDISHLAEHPVSLLQEMKREHEARMELLQSLIDERQSHILIYCANVGEHNAVVDFQRAALALVANTYLPADHRAIQLGLINSTMTDREPEFWDQEVRNLRRQFSSKCETLIREHSVKHLSVFAFAPIPLLIELGRLLSDIPAAEVYECHREPQTWKWQQDKTHVKFTIKKPESLSSPKKSVALILSLSGQITYDRVHKVLGDDIDVWEVTHASPKPGFLRTRESLSAFREIMRLIFDRIKATHGYDADLHIFPAVPLSAAVEVGRVWMPKADLSFSIYDQNRATGGFQLAHTISHS